MPFLRFTRDRRGIEHTFVMYAGGRRRPRLLYWFRTPPGLHVGRAALDEEAIRLLEESHPAISFDWTRILKPRSSAPGSKPRGRGTRAHAAPAPIVAAHAHLGEPPDTPPSSKPPGPSGPSQKEPCGGRVPMAASGAWRQMGTEALERLRGRFAELLARIAERVADPERREALRLEAEQLNPDAWVTREEIEAGIEAFDTRFAAVRGRLSRRRSRRGGRGPRPGQATGASRSGGGPDPTTSPPAASNSAEALGNEDPGDDEPPAL